MYKQNEMNTVNLFITNGFDMKSCLFYLKGLLD